jgi:hypothetical protein
MKMQRKIEGLTAYHGRGILSSVEEEKKTVSRKGLRGNQR